MPTFSLEQFAALMDLPEDEVREWVTLRLLDPARTGELDDIDLVRVMAVRRYGALGYSPPQFASAIQNSEVEPYLGEYLYPKLPPLSTEEAAACTGMPADRLKALRTALGIRRRSFLELDLELVEMFKTIGGAGMPVEAGLEGARVMSDALRRWPKASPASSTFTFTSGESRKA